MGVYIKGMEMPKDDCTAYKRVVISNYFIDGEMKILAHDDITGAFIGEVVDVPEPHGRLIDADALIKASGVTIQITGDENARVVAEALESIYQDIEDAQTVIDEEGVNGW